jgi:hypothetical protein
MWSVQEYRIRRVQVGYLTCDLRKLWLTGKNSIFVPRHNSPHWARASSLSHSNTTHSVGLLWTRDQPNAQTSTWQHTTLATDRHSCPRNKFEPAIPACDRPRTHDLEFAATGNKQEIFLIINIVCNIIGTQLWSYISLFGVNKLMEIIFKRANWQVKNIQRMVSDK